MNSHRGIFIYLFSHPAIIPKLKLIHSALPNWPGVTGFSNISQQRFPQTQTDAWKLLQATSAQHCHDHVTPKHKFHHHISSTHFQIYIICSTWISLSSMLSSCARSQLSGGYIIMVNVLMCHIGIQKRLSHSVQECTKDHMTTM